MTIPLHERLVVVMLSRGEQAAADLLSERLTAGDPEAAEIYREHQLAALGPDLLAVGACSWPAALDVPGTVVEVPVDDFLVGWRMWGIRGSHLVAPFVTAAWGVDRRAPGVEWRRGVNRSSTAWCGTPARDHPSPDCRCGIRAVQSRTVLDAFAHEMEDRLGAPGAVAQVAVWGHVTAYAPDDDWAYTLRAQYATIVSPFTLDPAHEPLRAGLERHYGTPGSVGKALRA